MTPFEDQRLLQPHLLPAERLLWTGRPGRGVSLRWADLFLIPFSLVWGGFAIFWNVMVWTKGAPLFFAAVGLPFLAMGLYLIAGRFLHEALLRSGLLYAVTDRRVIVLRTRFGHGFRSAEIGRLPALELEEHRGGRGTLRFEARPAPRIVDPGGLGHWVPAVGKRLVFDRIERARFVYDLVGREAGRRRTELLADPPAPRGFVV